MKSTTKWTSHKGMILPKTFFLQDDVVQIARGLLGKEIATHFNGQFTSGIIVETEAYAGIIDKASHAYNGRRTNRTEIMYAQGGTAYVYLCYGIHHLFNVVTNEQEIPHAVLVRAIEPLEGIELMLQRRGKYELEPSLTAGPGVMSRALGINTAHSGLQLGSEIAIKHAWALEESDIASGTRVGVSYAQDHALWPYRFWIKRNRFVSKGKGL